MNEAGMKWAYAITNVLVIAVLVLAVITLSRLNEVAEDVRSFKELLGLNESQYRSENVDYLNDLFEKLDALADDDVAIAAGEGNLFNRKQKLVDWINKARLEASTAVFRSSDQRTIVDRLCKDALKREWTLFLPDGEKPLRQWINENHPPSKK